MLLIKVVRMNLKSEIILTRYLMIFFRKDNLSFKKLY